MTTTAIAEITDFWLGPSLEHPDAANGRREWWYRGGPAVDDEIAARFAALMLRARAGELTQWERTANGALALVILLDQFTRNLFRSTPEAYSGDEIAFSIMSRSLRGELDEQLHPVARIWLYHPYHHSERIEDQDRGLARLRALEETAPPLWRPYVSRSIEGWTRHRDIVHQFGRFPHRNAVLGRVTSEPERRFLQDNGDAFGQGPSRPPNETNA